MPHHRAMSLGFFFTHVGSEFDESPGSWGPPIVAFCLGWIQEIYESSRSSDCSLRDLFINLKHELQPRERNTFFPLTFRTVHIDVQQFYTLKNHSAGH